MDEVSTSTLSTIVHVPACHVSDLCSSKTTVLLIELHPWDREAWCYYSCFVSTELQSFMLIPKIVFFSFILFSSIFSYSFDTKRYNLKVFNFFLFDVTLKHLFYKDYIAYIVENCFYITILHFHNSYKENTYIVLCCNKQCNWLHVNIKRIFFGNIISRKI